MSDGSVASNNDLMHNAAHTPSAGALLRAAREAQGLHIAALAVSLKVPVKKLEALEADRFEDLPDVVFARALASSVCRALKVDVAPILNALPQTARPRLSPADQNINTPFRAPGDGPGPSLVGQLSKPVVLAVLALLIGAAVLIFMPDLSQRIAGSLGGNSSTNNADVGTSMAAGPTDSAAGGMVTEQPASILPTAVVSANLANVSPVSNASVAKSTPTVASPTLVISSTLGAAPAPVPADGLVVFKATGETWVEVTNAKGQVTLRRILQAGETVVSSALPPLRVTVGRADQTLVTVRGQAYDLTGKVRDNVARFEVK